MKYSEIVYVIVKCIFKQKCTSPLCINCHDKPAPSNHANSPSGLGSLGTDGQHSDHSSVDMSSDPERLGQGKGNHDDINKTV
jgi:hypothetical protein